MNQYAYRARTAAGDSVEATLTAESKTRALETLDGQGLTVISVQPVNAEEPPVRLEKKRERTRESSVSLGDRALFCRQLAIAVKAGMPLRDAIDAIAEDMEKKGFKKVLNQVSARLRDGESFSSAIGHFPRTFSWLFVSLCRSAEESGSMPATLDRLAQYLEQTDRLARKVKSVLAYPMFVMVFFVIVCLIMTLFVVPQFDAIFTGFETKLPRLTQVVFQANQTLLRNGPAVVAAFVALLAAFMLFRKSKRGRYVLDGLKLRIPLLGKCFSRLAIARFCRHLALMIKGGVPISTALEVTSSACGNQVMEDALHRIEDRIVSGARLSESFKAEETFPHLVVRMVGVGEETGQLPEVMDQVATMYEEQFENSVTTMMSLFEPVILCVFGAFVLMLVLAIYMPIFTVASGVA